MLEFLSTDLPARKPLQLKCDKGNSICDLSQKAKMDGSFKKKPQSLVARNSIPFSLLDRPSLFWKNFCGLGKSRDHQSALMFGSSACFCKAQLNDG
jgi:hypothetical protein